MRWEYCDPIKGDVLLAALEYTISDDEVTHKRRVQFGILDLLAHLGGFTQILFAVGSYLISSYAQHNFLVKALKKLYMVRSKE